MRKGYRKGGSTRLLNPESRNMIRLQVVTVSRHSSSEVTTTHISYPPNEQIKTERKSGAEWEEIIFRVVEEEKPTIQIANIVGDAFIAGGAFKLIVNNPNLFGSFKADDTILLTTPRDLIR